MIERHKLISSPFNEKGIWYFRTLYGRFVKVKTAKYVYTLSILSKKKIQHKAPDIPETASDTLIFDTDDNGDITITIG